MAIVTNKDTEFAHKALEKAGIARFFEYVVCGDTLSSRKPDPAGAVSAMAHMGVSAAETVFIGDSVVDIQTARCAKLPVWAFSGGYNMGHDVRLDAPDAVFEHWSEVLSLAGLDSI